MRAVTVGDETIVSTLGHLYWVEGHGWKMARELQVGDRIHTVTGMKAIDAVNPAPSAAAYNLIVDDFNTYFVGHANLLVHDNEDRQSTKTLTPGLLVKSP